ncbi:MAG: hypothetical protein ACI9WU_002548 [Myxococcota bacterium]|jgi:hypothetical protein
MQDTPELLRRLLAAGFDMVIVGGVAAIAHGSARFTQDLDVMARFDAENMQRLHDALAATRPVHHPGSGVPLKPAGELGDFKNVYLSCTLGRLDILGDLGTSDFETLQAQAEVVPLFGADCRVLSLDDLIAAKSFAARPKDIEALIELRAIREKLRGSGA